jgi:hypothetical protein
MIFKSGEIIEKDDAFYVEGKTGVLAINTHNHITIKDLIRHYEGDKFDIWLANIRNPCFDDHNDYNNEYDEKK